MYEDIAPGATVYCADGKLGTVEHLVHDEHHGYVTDLMVHASSGETFRVPLELVQRVRSPSHVILNCPRARIFTAAAAAGQEGPGQPARVVEQRAHGESPRPAREASPKTLGEREAGRE